MSNPGYKSKYLATKDLYEYEVLKHDKTKNSNALYKAILVGLVFVVGTLAYYYTQAMGEVKRLQGELSTSQCLMVWQMDSSCFQQLETADMIQLKIND